MTYTGAMVLPKNAVMMSTDEKRYLEGGAQRGSNQYYREQQQRILKIQMSKLSKAEKQKIHKAVMNYQLGYIALALSGFAAVIGGTVLQIISFGTSSYTVLRSCK